MKTFNFRVHRHGNKLTLTLPSEWHKTNQIKAGDTLVIAINETMPYKLIVHSFSDVETKYSRLKSLLEDRMGEEHKMWESLVS